MFEIFYDRTRKNWPFNTGDCMGKFDCTWLYNDCKMPCLLDLPRCPEIRKMQIYFSIAQQKFFELGSEKCRLILALPNKISLNLDQKNADLF